jgi:lysyl-tRNA synthetase class 2
MYQQISIEKNRDNQIECEIGKLKENKREEYINKFSNDLKNTVLVSSIINQFKYFTKKQLEKCRKNRSNSYTIGGRIILKRVIGKTSFIKLQDQSGCIQIYCNYHNLKERYENIKVIWDLGDIVSISGYIIKTNKNELSIHANEIRLLTKSIKALPDKFRGLNSQENCYRHRYIDLIINKKTRQIFQLRTKIIKFIRFYFDKSSFMEVETPMMQSIPGGAIAKPFITKHNALNIPLYLRISPELYLKKLIIGGLGRVYEINKSFRNEGLSTRHNPEFTMLEFYQSYASCDDLMKLTEDLIRKTAHYVLGKKSIMYQGRAYNLEEKFKRMTLVDAILHFNPKITRNDLMNQNKALSLSRKLKINIPVDSGLGKIHISIFEKNVEEKLIEPTFITEYPVEVSPLAKKNKQNPFITDRFELFIAGKEIANGFSELNDSKDQNERFKQQIKLNKTEKEHKMHYDYDYVTALEHGMPPTAGEGIGIDRLTMFFTNSKSIKDVILFPQMKKK